MRTVFDQLVDRRVHGHCLIDDVTLPSAWVCGLPRFPLALLALLAVRRLAVGGLPSLPSAFCRLPFGRGWIAGLGMRAVALCAYVRMLRLMLVDGTAMVQRAQWVPWVRHGRR